MPGLVSHSKERAERDLEVIQSTRKALLDNFRRRHEDRCGPELLWTDHEILRWDPRCRAGTGWLGSTPQPGPALVLDRAVLRLQREAADENQRLVRERDSTENETPYCARSMLMLGLLMALGLTACCASSPGHVKLPDPDRFSWDAWVRGRLAAAAAGTAPWPPAAGLPGPVTSSPRQVFPHPSACTARGTGT